MERYKVILAYDGTDFYGFQIQGNQRTVQGVVEEALRQVGWQGSHLAGAGRTDTGVHASGQVIAFDLAWKHSCEALVQALNMRLPPDVAARSAAPASPEFDPRRHALSRTYRYQVFFEPGRDPLRERYAWRVWPAANTDLLIQAAAALAGEHDFAAFGTPPKAGGSTVRTVYRAIWLAQADGLVFEVEANAFLYHMVRRMVSVQVAIGQGWQSMNMLLESLAPGARNEILHGLAPAQGLSLTQVSYPPPGEENRATTFFNQIAY